jgi:serine/threonine-protein kinase SRPK3
MLELDIMREIRDSSEENHLPVLKDTFTIERTGGGKHICLVMDVLGPDVATLRHSAPKKALPVYVVKTIIKQVLVAVSHLHRLGIVHTGNAPPSGFNDVADCS